MGSAVGLWQMFEAKKSAKEANNLTRASMVASAEETGRAKAEAKAEEQKAAANTPGVATTPNLDDATNLAKKKKGVQSTFTARPGSGEGMMKGTTLTPIGGD